METGSESANAYSKVSTGNTISTARLSATTPFASSRPNEMYGSTAMAIKNPIPSSASCYPTINAATGIIYLSVLIGDMTRGILFPTVTLRQRLVKMLSCFTAAYYPFSTVL